MRVMYVANNPDGARTLQIEGEVHDLQDRLDRSAGTDPIDFRVYTRLDLANLTDTVRRVQPDVLHFAAHGDRDRLVFGHPSDGHVEVSGAQLSTFLSGLTVKPKLIVVNACSSNGIAADLARAEVARFVIGTDASISNTGARAMAAALYQRLADTASVGEAYEVAAAHLALIDREEVAVTLHPEGSMQAARRLRLVDPLRIVAQFPLVEKWLRAGLVKPKKKDFRPEFPGIRFGVAGAPAAARQTVFFTDDETVKAKEGESLAEARSWIIESQPIKSEIWMDDTLPYYGDMNWFVSITTTDARIVSAQSTITTAIERYYFTELWKGELPSEIAKIVRESIECLQSNDGSHRGRLLQSRSSA